jgi:hypothetical protein
MPVQVGHENEPDYHDLSVKEMSQRADIFAVETCCFSEIQNLLFAKRIVQNGPTCIFNMDGARPTSKASLHVSSEIHLHGSVSP